VISSGKPIAEVARNLGIVETTLGNWVAKARENGEADEPELDVSERAELARLRKEIQQVKMERDFLKSGGLLREPESIRFGFIAEMAAEKAFPIAFMCRLLGVSRQGFYQWRGRPPARRALDDAALTERIKKIHAGHRRGGNGSGSPSPVVRPVAASTRMSSLRMVVGV
jgi:hypothetical protein